MNASLKSMSAFLFCGLLGCAAVGGDRPKAKVGDVIEVSLTNLPKGEKNLWDGDYRVNGAGEIDLPLLGGFAISGLTLDEASSGIEKALRDRAIYRDPELDLMFRKAAW